MVHESAATGYERESATYAAARPSYHPTVLQTVAAVAQGSAVLDLGAGTGIATRALLALGLEVIAVEPVAAMRSQLLQQSPDVQVLDGTAESIPLDDGSVGTVVVAQAFHWFDHGPALDEISRVLDPGGCLVTLWNVRDESVPWVAAYTEVVDRVQGTTPRYRDMVWRSAIEADSRFVLADEVRVPNPQPSDADRTVGRFLSTSFIASLEAAEQAAMESEIREIVSGLGDTFDYPYLSEAQIWRFIGLG